MRPFLRFGRARPRLLTLLYLLLLGRVFLFQLLGLLGVPLFQLLFLRVVRVFLVKLLVFFFLLLLQLLVFLILFGNELVLLLLVPLVGRRIAGIGRRGMVRLEFTRVTRARGRGTPYRVVSRPCSTGGRRFVCSASLSGGYYAALEVSGLGGGRDGRLALIVSGAQRWVHTSLLDMLLLCGNPADVLFPAVGFFL